MYTEDYENRGFPFRDFLLKLILIIIFVFLLVWLLPKFIAPKVVENINNNSTTINSKEIDALGSQIFNDNLNTMKEAAITYYTDERLPKEIGVSDKMTLSDMIGKKLVVALIDKNNKACDVEESYVQITKADDEYILKVNLKDSEKEDYILVHLGCYTYCDTYVCEKEETQIIVKGEKPGTTPTDNPTTNPTTKPTTNPTTSPEPSDEPTPLPTDQPSDPEPTPSADPKYIYEYEKTSGLEFSAWTKWSAWEKTSCDTKAVNCSDSSSKCLFKQQLYSRKENIGTYEKKYTTTYQDVVQTGSYTQKACSNYNYVIINSKTYATTTTYTTVNTITSTTAGTTGSWKYVGRGTYSNPPTSTSTTKYVWVGADFSYCEETCESLPKHTYDKYTYTGSMSTVTNTTSTPSSSSTGSSSSSTTVTAECGSYVTKEVPIYSTIDKTKIATRTETLYGTVCYKSTKTRKITDPGKTQYKWSYYGDTSLLNNGWQYTGERKLAS